MPGERGTSNRAERANEENISSFIEKIRSAASIEEAKKLLPPKYQNLRVFGSKGEDEMNRQHAEANQENVQQIIEQIRSAGSDEEARKVFDSSELASQFDHFKGSWITGRWSDGREEK